MTSGSTRSELFDGLTAAEKAKVDLTSSFAINSLVWMLLKTRGVDPRESEAKAEVARVRACIQRLKEVEVRQARPTRVDAEAAKRFVKSGLWMPDKDKEKDRKRQQGEGQEQPAEKKRARRGR